ncbi:sigma factor-like helix-turn-helix DNA-binding protein [Prevotella sp. DNF00663]|uniref:helix-turn-helix transcriptional regulator n=1 Tax=Prevotella sp. DNF00663 TaxID=1384078 RepID=UPI0018D23886|nr:sigma factor-like helix-turn-helix DNA-binding protein [Prevotella sp. DNF00663]
MVERFVRCNFGEHDLLTQDIEHDMLHFEEVRCPLRGGYCKHENIICRPKGVVNISPAERVVVSLYLDGMTFDKISHLLHKSPSTIKTQLLRVKQKLKVKNCREIIRIMRLYNY